MKRKFVSLSSNTLIRMKDDERNMKDDENATKDDERNKKDEIIK